MPLTGLRWSRVSIANVMVGCAIFTLLSSAQPASSASVVTADGGGVAPTTLLVSPLAQFDDPSPSLELVQIGWQQATPLELSLSAGRDGNAPVPAEVRATYSRFALFLWLHWQGFDDQPPQATVTQQRATVTWKRSEAIGGCAVVCHVSFSTGPVITSLQLVAPDISATPMQQLEGVWSAGWWTLAYSRPLDTDSPVDIQFSSLTATYHFGIDVAGGDQEAHTNGEQLLMEFVPVS